MTRLALELSIRAAATRTGGGGPPVLASDGVLLTAFDDKLLIRDTTTPANAYEGVPATKIVTIRASQALYYDVAGVIQTAAIGALRRDYDPRIAAAGIAGPGYLTEIARTNVVWWSTDLTNAVWVPTSVTTAKNQTGPDGVANSASSLTATAANGQIIQTTSVGSSARAQSTYIKRLTGLGSVFMTMDNGTTWTPVTVTAAWTKVEIPTQTLANPQVGLRLAISGDSVAVWNMQNENGLEVSSSAIPTTSAQTTRAADVPRLATTLFPYNQPEGTLYAKAMCATYIASLSQVLIGMDDGTISNKHTIQRNGGTRRMECFTWNSTLQGNAISLNAIPNLAAVKVAHGYKLNDFGISTNGETTAVDAVGTIPTVTFLTFGNPTAATGAIQGWLFEAMYLSTRRTNTELQALSA